MWLFQEPCDIQDKTDLFSFNSLCGAFNRPFLHVLPAFGRRTYDMWSCCSADQGRLSARSWGRREFGESSWSSLKLSWKIKQQTTEWNAPLPWVNSGVWSDTLDDESAQLNKRLNKGVAYYIFNFSSCFIVKQHWDWKANRESQRFLTAAINSDVNEWGLIIEPLCISYCRQLDSLAIFMNRR